MVNKLKYILVAMLLTVATNMYAAEVLYLPIVEVYDGDTIKTDLKYQLPPPLNVMRIRIRGIDTPEMPAKSYSVTGKLGRAKCIKEAELAIKATAKLQELANASMDNYMRVTNFKWDKYGGRIVGEVYIDHINVAKALLDNGFAVVYNGKGKKEDWCR